MKSLISIVLLFCIFNLINSVSSYCEENIHLIYQNPNKLYAIEKRDDFPIKISNFTWKVFTDIKNSCPFSIKYDPTRLNNTISRNITASLAFSKDFECHIFVYEVPPSESSIIHELLHAFLIVQGYPSLFSNDIQLKDGIDNIENNIKHIFINKKLKEFKLYNLDKEVEKWKEGAGYFYQEIENKKADIRKATLDLYSIAFVLNAFNIGISIEEIKKELHPITHDVIDIGNQIYTDSKKYNLNNVKDNFDFRIGIASKLNLKKGDIKMKSYDFKKRKIKLYDIKSGEFVGYSNI